MSYAKTQFISHDDVNGTFRQRVTNLLPKKILISWFHKSTLHSQYYYAIVFVDKNLRNPLLRICGMYQLCPAGVLILLSAPRGGYS